MSQPHTQRRNPRNGKPTPAALILCEHQDEALPCGQPFARLYYSGLRCAAHAPTEAQIRAVAAARARARGAHRG